VLVISPSVFVSIENFLLLDLDDQLIMREIPKQIDAKLS
jgi:hypothetical protein